MIIGIGIAVYIHNKCVTISDVYEEIYKYAKMDAQFDYDLHRKPAACNCRRRFYPA